MIYLLALASAALYGAADFLGGLTSRRASTIAVVVISQLTGLLLLAVLLPVLPSASPGLVDVGWGAAAGIAGGAGAALLYRALAVGAMAVVAPITAVCAAAIPVLVAVGLGERPGRVTAGGIALAIASIVLVSRQHSGSAPDGMPRTGARGIALAFAAGVAIALFFLTLAHTSRDAGLWPLLVARIVSVGLFGALVVLRRTPLRMARRVLLLAVLAGILDIVANALYVVAAREGPLSVVVTLSSLYPASTVVLARMVVGERLNATQVVGIVCALVAVALIVGY